MKSFLSLITLLLVSSASYAQFYVSAAGGYALPSAGVRFGEEISLTKIENTYGSYGEGIHAQLRAGYTFDSNFAVELALGYLHGADQTSRKINVPTQPVVDIYARGRAFGLGASLVYNFNKNLYGRFGALIKIGGQTEAIGSIKGINLPVGSIPNITSDTTLDIDFEQHYNGKLPLGFVGAVGYKYPISDTFTVFAELEYTGISITRDKATMESFNARLRENGLPLNVDQVREIFAASGNELAAIMYNEINFVDELPTTNTDGSRQLAQKVPYSSFGFNIGITYTFGKPKTKEEQ